LREPNPRARRDWEARVFAVWVSRAGLRALWRQAAKVSREPRLRDPVAVPECRRQRTAPRRVLH
jgi:hypothetical protein